ncbi:DUF2214 domain-containing protein [Roseomonas marmotae]|uniref:DUF2214 domain-containing protein n=1 Tax=Roseomonas marmotae TaxID=2768161 RepID=A0ABS3KA33_9PROT|nr:DUF2214 domain-containing protein [Roseomonas marmotae]MBO1074302.1 DUF2214 domain-containing protein [Roseomonas marmotae]QTI78056.1 DUF2214 domain-containing protein [Roseomonas marmotae]
MEAVQALADWPGAVWLRHSGTAYLFVNAAHILGIGLVLGAILPLDLRLMGFFRQVPLAVLGPFLTRAAAAGLALALLTGFWLFTVRPPHYLGNAAFLAKLALLACALLNIGLQHGAGFYRLAVDGGAVAMPVRVMAAASAILWLAALVAGRWIGFL